MAFIVHLDVIVASRQLEKTSDHDELNGTTGQLVFMVGTYLFLDLQSVLALEQFEFGLAATLNDR